MLGQLGCESLWYVDVCTSSVQVCKWQVQVCEVEADAMRSSKK